MPEMAQPVRQAALVIIACLALSTMCRADILAAALVAVAARGWPMPALGESRKVWDIVTISKIGTAHLAPWPCAGLCRECWQEIPA